MVQALGFPYDTVEPPEPEDPLDALKKLPEYEDGIEDGHEAWANYDDLIDSLPDEVVRDALKREARLRWEAQQPAIG